jgi:hypothetical protein
LETSAPEFLDTQTHLYINKEVILIEAFIHERTSSSCLDISKVLRFEARELSASHLPDLLSTIPCASSQLAIALTLSLP